MGRLRERAGPNVELTGYASDEDLLAWYRRAAVYVQASRHEGFGLAVAEGMLAGCVPVVLDVTAMPEVVGDAGVLISSQDPGGGGRRRAASAGAGARGRTTGPGTDPHRIPPAQAGRRAPAGGPRGLRTRLNPLRPPL